MYPRTRRPAPIIATELPSGAEVGSVEAKEVTGADPPKVPGKPTLNWLGRITLPSEPPATPIELLMVEVVKVELGIDPKEVGEIKASGVKDAAGNMVLVSGTEDCTGDIRRLEKLDAAGITETAGTSRLALVRGALEMLPNIESKAWHPTTREIPPP